MDRYSVAPLLILLSVYGLIATTGGCSRQVADTDVFNIGSPQEATYVGGAQCKSCHEKAWAEWRTSHHFRAMEPANDSTVLGDFTDAVLTADGVTSRFFKRDGKFYIHTQGDDGTYKDFEVLYTFGIYPLQQYLVAFPGGRMQATRASWDSRDKRWFHQYPGQEIHHRDWLHWTGNGQNWNTMCASCHSTDLQKNYDAATDSYATTWSELNVSCESCHGPGSRHLDYVNSAAYKEGQRLPGAALWYGRDTITQLQLNTCVACHARKSDIAQAVMRTDEIMDDHIPQVISTDFYYADGQIREEDYEYGSFTQSKMFHQNVRCAQCHNPHSGKTYHAGNTLCLQCHKPEYDTPQHHFHKPGTEAALCVNCHMTVRTYMGNDHRRDHSFRVPRPDQSVTYDTPNACTGCHKEKSNAWAAEAVKTWYGPERKHHFSDDLLPGSRLDADSEAPLVRLLADTAQPAIARATAAHYLGSLEGVRSADALRKALADKQAIVRYYALRALANFPPEAWQQAAAGSLRDTVRAVRIAAADLYHALPAANIPAAAREDFARADTENRAYLEYQADFAVGNVMLGDYALQGGDVPDAITHYQRGLRKDSLMNYARFNLAVAYNSIGQNTDALRTLQSAAAIDPFNDRAFYTLGLLHAEMGNTAAALDALAKAVRLNTPNPQAYYNYGLLLQQSGKQREAETTLLQGLERAPQSAALHYALAFLYLQNDTPDKALPHAKALRALDPGNPDYQALFKQFNL